MVTLHSLFLANRNLGVVHISEEHDIEVFVEFGPIIVMDQKTDDSIALFGMVTVHRLD